MWSESSAPPVIAPPAAAPVPPAPSPELLLRGRRGRRLVLPVVVLHPLVVRRRTHCRRGRVNRVPHQRLSEARICDIFGSDRIHHKCIICTVVERTSLTVLAVRQDLGDLRGEDGQVLDLLPQSVDVLELHEVRVPLDLEPRRFRVACFLVYRVSDS